MSPPAKTLAPPKDDLFTSEQLEHFNGATLDTPIYVAIKGSFAAWSILTHNFTTHILPNRDSF